MKRKHPRRKLAVFEKLFWVLVRMETGSHRGHAGHSSSVASGWIPVVLEAYFQSPRPQADWAKTDSEGSAPVDLPNGRRESDVGSTTHPRRASNRGTTNPWLSSGSCTIAPLALAYFAAIGPPPLQGVCPLGNQRGESARSRPVVGAVRGGIHWTVCLTKNSSRNSFVARCDLLVAFSPAGYAPPVRALAC